MKITIEPSNANGEGAEHYYAVTIDTRTNDELTSQAVEAALAAIVAYGHTPNRVAEAAEQWAEMSRATKPDVP